MTIQRSERSAEDVLYELASSYPGGVEALAGRLGMSPRVLYKKLSASVPDRAPSVKEFSQILDMAQDANCPKALDPLHALCWRHGGVFISLDEVGMDSEECIRRAMMVAVKHVGEVAGSVDEALEDEEITEKHMEKMEPKFRKTITAIVGLLARMKSRMKRDPNKPKTSIFAKVKRSNSHDFDVATH